MVYTYVLYSHKDGRWYTGVTKDLRARMREHRGGRVLSTKSRRPLTLVYYEASLDEDDAWRRARRGIGYLAQDPSVFRGLTVEENILMILQANGAAKAAQHEVLERLLREFGLLTVRKQRGVTLSGGERRRVEIARVLAMNPSYVLLDEPFTGVDPRSVAELQDVVRYLKQRGLGIVITDHNVRDTLAITDRATVIHEGRILLEGKPGDILADPEVRRVFLGEHFEL